ncbi:MAG: hypothetical protein WC346_06785 [Methanogenium sp.]|jgi:DNA ligase-1
MTGKTTMQDIPAILDRLSKTSSSNAKKDILRETKSKELEYIFKEAYDPFINFGVAKIDISSLTFDESKNIDTKWLDDLKDLLSKLENRKLTGNLARDTIKSFISQYPKDWGNLVLKILKKDLRIGAGASIINKIYPRLFPEDFCMAAMKYQSSRVSYPVYADSKLDGVRCIALINDNIKLLSRNGREFRNYPFIAEEIKELGLNNNTKLDGEIVMGHFQDLMRTISRKEEGIELAKDAVYNVFDTAETDKTFEERLKTLDEIEKTIESKKLKHIKIIRGKRMNNEEELTNFYNEQLEKGFEGIMVKALDGVYEHKRTYAWMKMKPENSEDAPIVRVEEGSGKYKNLLGAFVCKLPDNTEVNVGSGFLDEERIEFWKRRNDLVGQIVEIKYQEKTKDGSLRFPVFVRFRKDLK